MPRRFVQHFDDLGGKHEFSFVLIKKVLNPIGIE
jgi:hypothetical protein